MFTRSLVMSRRPMPIKMIKEAGGIADAEEKALAYIYRAKKALRRADLKYPAKKDMIEKLADYVIERNY